MKNEQKCLIYSAYNIGEHCCPYSSFSFKVRLWGVGISNDHIDLCRTPPHIIKSVNIGGQ